MFALLADINANAGVPYNRLAVGFQTHVTAGPGGFPSKAAFKANFAKLAALGAEGMVTEVDIKISGSSSANLRYQAAIWGDYIDVSLSISGYTRSALWLLPLTSAQLF
jgi:endo-1,4-beta-xylanase